MIKHSFLTPDNPMLLRILSFVAVVSSLSLPLSAAEPEFSAAQLEFFESKVRPLLVARCFKCHGPKAKKLQGGLLLDSRAALLRGGDTGPAITPGDPAESLLIDSINYGDLYEMPPDSKMPKEEIALLTKWVEMGAPWPAEEGAPAVTKEAFNLEHRAATHWAWRSVADPAAPKIRQQGWVQDPLDAFILAKLESQQLQPTDRADKRTLIRRAYFDLIGLPPTPEQVQAFLADESPDAFTSVIDTLLKSPQFGERWARHWLDLVRYAESRGHEFDYSAANVFHYRDYVIRAFNTDTPYDQFVTEHIAGDLTPEPRRSPSGSNESVLGTGFWHLGEWVHSPVDIRKDETDRYDNMIDVFSKTFLGLTVSCARCHDHKFDAISQADYYALGGFLQSSAYHQVRFDTLDHNRSIAQQLRSVEQAARPAMMQELRTESKNLEQFAEYLLAARAVLIAGPTAKQKNAAQDIVVEDFEAGDYEGWKITGDAFGQSPQTKKTIANYQGDVKEAGKGFVNSHNLRDGKKGDAPTGELLSSPLKLERDYLTFLVGGGAHQGKTCVNLLVGGKVVLTATGRNNNQMHPHRWDVRPYRGQMAQLQIVDRFTGGWGNIGVDHFVLTDAAEKGAPAPASDYRAAADRIAKERKLDPARLLAWFACLLSEKQGDLLYDWARLTEKDDWAAFIKNQSTPQQQPKTTAPLQIIADYTSPATPPLLANGPTFGSATLQAGDLLMNADGSLAGLATVGQVRRDPTFNKLRLKGGVQKEPGKLGNWDAAGRTFRTPTFTVTEAPVRYLVQGSGRVLAVVDSHRMLNGPLHGVVAKTFSSDKPVWITHNLRDYIHHGVHLEFVAEGDKSMQVFTVVEGEQTTPPWERPNNLLTQAITAGESPEAHVAALAKAFQAALQSAGSTESLEPASAVLADWLLRHRTLWTSEPSASLVKLKQERQTLIDQIQWESRLAPATWDGTGVDETLLIRGNVKTPGKPVPRRLLTAIAGDQPKITAGSGRLELARRIVDPSNPFVSRVQVNRIWHHLMGRGIVPSVDNFGVLGQAPTHPELLDHLAVRYMQEGWSTKTLIRQIMLSSTYQLSSFAEPANHDKDPLNQWHGRANIRRLQGEAIRDTVLMLSGRLDRTMFGPSVPIFLSSFMQGRGRPGSGPLDGNGRRSIYLSVRRNFLPPMMLAFDTPQPFSTVGRRSVSNVPAQALILMNDPFIVQQAGLWAKRLLAETDTPEQRITRLYEEAFSRPPTAEEVATAMQFIQQQGQEHGLTPDQSKSGEKPWTDLCHVMINVKDFIFVY